jgi:hypothetical protein
MKMKINNLIITIIFISMSLAILRADSPLSVFVAFNSMAALLLFASIKAKFCGGPEGAWWYGFSLFGWANLLLGFAENPYRYHGPRLLQKEILLRFYHGEILQSIANMMNFFDIKGIHIVDEVIILFTVPVGMFGAKFCSFIYKTEPPTG